MVAHRYSGEVIAGEIGSGSFGLHRDRRTGRHRPADGVGAPAGRVMLSESTARLVEAAAVLGKPQRVHVKGAGDRAISASAARVVRRTRPIDVPGVDIGGREWEVGALATMMIAPRQGAGPSSGISGPAGIGKTRLVRETLQLAELRASKCCSFCESHAIDVPYRVMGRLLRAVSQTTGLSDEEAREKVRVGLPSADPQDLHLLCDLLGVADPDVTLPKIDPDARRRRMTALIDAYLRPARTGGLRHRGRALDRRGQRIMLADLLTVIAQTPSIVLMTYRPDYRGVLQQVAGAQTFALAPLTDSEAAVLMTELLGHDPTVGDIGDVIAARVHQD